MRPCVTLAPGAFGILEPTSGQSVEASELDLVLVPARAFDRKNGNRLGRGKGYYDRLLERLSPRAFKCGIAFDCQILPTLPISPHDVPVDAVVTESGILRAG